MTDTTKLPSLTDDELEQLELAKSVGYVTSVGDGQSQRAVKLAYWNWCQLNEKVYCLLHIRRKYADFYADYNTTPVKRSSNSAANEHDLRLICPTHCSNKKSKYTGGTWTLINSIPIAEAPALASRLAQLYNPTLQ